MYIAIQPKEEKIYKEFKLTLDGDDLCVICETNIIDNINIDIIELKLNAYAVIETCFYSGSTFIKKTHDILNNDNYYKWGSDDNYIINFICNKYNLSKL